jgi:TonB family protein
MAKRSKKLQLQFKIEKDGQSVYRRLTTPKETLTVGKNNDNDVVWPEFDLRKEFRLVERNSKGYYLRLTDKMQGQVLAGSSKVSFQDLIAHDVLKRKGSIYFYPLNEEKRGVVQIGDTTLTFGFVEPPPPPPKVVVAPDFKGFSWYRATWRNLTSDFSFKLIFIFVAACHILFISYINGLSVDLTPDVDLTVIPERLTRLIVQKPEEIAADIGSSARDLSDVGEEETETEEQPETPKRKAVESQGVLGLLTGQGKSGKSGDLADFLLGNDLVKELDDVMSSTALSVGRSSNGGESNLDALFSGAENAAGIDDLLGSLDEGVEGASLTRKGELQLDQVGDMSASAGAEGKRSEDSVRRVLLEKQGRLTYIYNKHLRRIAGLAGKMVVEVAIAADGSVQNVRMVSSSMRQPEFEREILSYIQTWQYGVIEEGTVTVTYPLVFNKVG